jgi:hypothetical protein
LCHPVAAFVQPRGWVFSIGALYIKQRYPLHFVFRKKTVLPGFYLAQTTTTPSAAPTNNSSNSFGIFIALLCGFREECADFCLKCGRILIAEAYVA